MQDRGKEVERSFCIYLAERSFRLLHIRTIRQRPQFFMFILFIPLLFFTAKEEQRHNNVDFHVCISFISSFFYCYPTLGSRLFLSILACFVPLFCIDRIHQEQFIQNFLVQLRSQSHFIRGVYFTYTCFLLISVAPAPE